MAATRVSIQTLYLSIVCCQIYELLTEQVSIVGNTDAHMNCSNNYSIDIANVTVTHLKTSCKSRSCNLKEIKESIIRNCDGKQSCLLMSNLSDGCLLDPGFVNFSYRCNAIAVYCDFDNNVCNWTVYDSSTNYSFTKINWKNHELGPFVDHTTLTEDGFYFSFGAYSYYWNYDIYLRSETIMSSNKQCLSFWYNMGSYDIRFLSVYQIVNTEEYIKLWEESAIKGFKWYNIRLNLNTNFVQYTIAFAGSNQHSIAIDDIVIYNTKCEASQFNCDFETQCWWTSDYDKEYRWKTITGQTIRYPGPKFDRTTGSRYGQFIYLAANNNSEGSKANFSSPIITPSSEMCFSFWYHMYGSRICSLAVYFDDTEGSRLVWIENENHGNKWLQALVNISSANSLTIRIEGTRGKSADRNIAVDDLALTPASCSGYILQSQTCLPITEPIQPTYCPNHFIDLEQNQITFEPMLDSCGEVYKEMQNMFRNQCIDSEMKACSYDIFNESQKRPECFLLNNIKVDYTCKVLSTPETTVGYSSPAISDSSFASNGVISGVVGVVCLLLGTILGWYLSTRIKICKDATQKQKDNYLDVQPNRNIKSYEFLEPELEERHDQNEQGYNELQFPAPAHHYDGLGPVMKGNQNQNGEVYNELQLPSVANDYDEMMVINEGMNNETTVSEQL